MGEKVDIVFLLLRNGFDPDIFCKSPDSAVSDVQISEGQPVGRAFEQQTATNPTADADVSSEVTDHLDQPRDDSNVAGSSLGSEVTSYTQVRFRAAAICARLEVRWFQGIFFFNLCSRI